MSFRIHLEAIRQQKNLSMAEVSHRSHVDFKTVKELCRDPQRNTTIETLSRLALALNVSMDELVEIIVDDEPSQI